MFLTKITAFSKMLRKIYFIPSQMRHYSKTIKPNLLPEEVNQIVNVLNEKDDKGKLRSTNIRQTQIDKIADWRLTNGDFKNVEQLFEIKGFTGSVVDKLCAKLTESEIENSHAKAKNSRKPHLCIPVLNRQQRNAIKSFVSIYTTPFGVGWSRFEVNEMQSSDNCMKRDVKITDWENFNIELQKLHLVDVAKLYLQIHNLIPHGDVYAFEEIDYNSFGKIKGNLKIQQTQAIAMLAGLLVNRTWDADMPSDTNVYFMSSKISAKLFGILVDNEIGSTKFVMDKILNPSRRANSYLVGDSAELITAVTYNIEDALRVHYKRVLPIVQEQLGRSLLVGAAFLRLCIIGCEQSVELVTTPLPYDPKVRKNKIF